MLLKNKPNILKTTYLKEKIIEKIYDLWYLKYTKNFIWRNKGKILVSSLDGLGDNVIKQKTFDLLCERFGNENVYILCLNGWSNIFSNMGYNVIGYKIGKTIIEKLKNKIKLCKQLNELGIDKYIYLENSWIHEIDDKIHCIERIGFYKEKKDNKLNVNIEFKDEYILNNQQRFIKEYLNKKISIKELKPNLRKILREDKTKDIISIGIGASTRRKSLPIEKMAEILEFLLKKYPQKKLLLLGAGKKQKEYTNKLLKYIKNENIIDCVDKFSLMETAQTIGNSLFFIGYDSGLSNLALSLNTKYLCLFWTEKKEWLHPFENAKFILGNMKNYEEDKHFGTPILNSITLNQIEIALHELNL